jgi:signal-transduction protein with cAMP-binding, CBS, and nucleotidyltransferase domain
MAETTFIYNKFLEYIDKITPLTTDERDIFLRRIMIKEYKKGEIIIQEGVKSNYIYYIHKGIVRNFINQNNKTRLLFLTLINKARRSIMFLNNQKEDLKILDMPIQIEILNYFKTK